MAFPKASAIGRGWAILAGQGVGIIPPALTNTVAPVIDDVVIGNALKLASPGVWSDAITTASAIFSKNGVPVGANYTPVEADRGATFTAFVTASAANGASGSVASAGKPARRTRATLAYGFGRLTKNTFGSVPYASPYLRLLGSGVTAPTSWATGAPSAGTDGHFTRTSTTNTPSISTSGSTAALPDAAYVYPVTATFADGVIEVTTLTITPVSGVFTIGQADNLTAIGTTHKTAIDGQTVEFAAGNDLNSQSSGRRIFSIWRFTAATRLRAHDLSRIGWPTGWEWQNCLNMICDDFQTADTDKTGVIAHFGFSRSGSTPDYNENITLNRPRFVGSGAFYTDATKAKYAGLFRACRNVVLNDGYFERVSGGFSGGATTPGDGIEGVFINNVKVRHYFDNALITGYNSTQTWTMNYPIFMAPDRVVDGLHVDFLQVHDSVTSGCSVTINGGMSIHAEGTAMIQGIYGGNATNLTDGNNATQITVNGYIYIGGAVSALNMIAGRNCSIRKLQSIFGGADRITKPTIDVVFNNTCSFNTGIGGGSAQHQLGQGAWTGTNIAERIVLFGSVTNNVTNLTFNNVIQHSGQGYSTAEAGQGSPNFGRVKVLPPYVTGNYHDVDPVEALRILPYETMSFDQVVAAVKNIVRPKLDGAYKLGDGSYLTALLPDGSWNPA